MTEIKRLIQEIAELRKEIAALRAERTIHHYHHQVLGQSLLAPNPYLPTLPPYRVTGLGGSANTGLQGAGHNA